MAYCLVEWPEKAQTLLPPCDIQVFIEIEEHIREVVIKANTVRGKDVLQRLTV